MEAHMLRINLSDKSYQIEEIPRGILKKYLGGRGLGSYLLYKLVPAKADPLSGKNHLIFTAGPASGTGLYYSSKTNLSTKSPLTGILLFSICGGTLGQQMKKAGFWAIDIEGIADSPTYIVINNQKVEFKDATPIWGMETAEAQRAIRGPLSEKKAAAVTIGPAAERLIKYASIFSEGPLYRCFGRGGGGCVMGSKKLKGMVVLGDGKVDVADRDRFEAVNERIAENVKQNKGWADFWRRYGSADLQMLQGMGILPTRNWNEGQFEDWERISRPTSPIPPGGWPKKAYMCGPFCLTPCSHYVDIKEGPYQGAHCDGPEYETVYAFGSSCGVDKMDAIVAAMQICNEGGIDSMTAGTSIGFAMECFEKGLIGLKDTDGIELRFGNDRGMIEMLKKIVAQEGAGRRFGQGVKRLSEEIKGSESFAMHAKGLELGGYECRGSNGQALQYAIDNRGGCHHGYGLPARIEVSDGTRLQVVGKGRQVKEGAIDYIIRDCMVVCTFVPPFVIDQSTMAEAVSSVSGEPWSVDDLKVAAMRIMCQERLFNIREEGITRKDDALPARLLNEPKPDGPIKGVVAPLEELKDDYYLAMGWDISTGNPTNSLLDELEIER